VSDLSVFDYMFGKINERSYGLDFFRVCGL